MCYRSLDEPRSFARPVCVACRHVIGWMSEHSSARVLGRVTTPLDEGQNIHPPGVWGVLRHYWMNVRTFIQKRKLFDKVFGHLKFGEEQRTEEEVLSDLYDKKREVRKKASDDLTNGFQSQLHILSHIFNTILADKMIDDRLRKYDSWVSTMNLYNELEKNTVEVLVDCVTSRYDISQRYYKIKKQLLDLPELYDYDRYAPIPHLPDTKIPWEECKTMVLDAFRD